MTRRSTLILAALLFILTGLTAIGVYSQEDITHVADSAFARRIRPPVPFVHDEHNENAGIEECNVCHHVYENGKKSEYDSSEGSECSECHLGDDVEDVMPVIRVYHLRCKGCHQEAKAGPVMCGECHVRG